MPDGAGADGARGRATWGRRREPKAAGRPAPAPPTAQLPPRAENARGGSTIPRVRRPGSVAVAVAAAVALASAAGGSADAQGPPAVTVAPSEADPGATVFVTNSPGSPCTPPTGSGDRPTASVDLYPDGSATPANRLPYQGFVSATGSWAVEVRLAPDLPPGRYRVEARCYTDSGLNSGFGPAYQPGRLEVRLRQLGPPALSSRSGRPGDSVQVSAGQAGCVPPAGATSPRVRVSILDRDGATRAEAEGGVDRASGLWSVPVRVPPIDVQLGQVAAVCLARVGASVPYARYAAAAFAVEAAPADDPAAPPLAPPDSTPAPVLPVPGPATSAATTPPVQLPDTSLPLAPVAKAIIAEPTYTG